MTQHVPDDAVVGDLHEEIQDGVARRRAALIREFPQREHSFALLVEIRPISQFSNNSISPCRKSSAMERGAKSRY